jgi:hypothetical protein
MNCSRCNTPMQSLGQLPIRVGGTSGGWHLVLGEWADLGEKTLPLDVYRCATCTQVQFFDLALSIPGR